MKPAALLALIPLVAGCGGTAPTVAADVPPVTFAYRGTGLAPGAERAEAYCAEHGLAPRLRTATHAEGETRATFDCI